MATIRVPPNCVSITTAGQGLATATANLITITSALELTNLVSCYQIGPGGTCIRNTNPDGTVNLNMPTVVTAININGIGYTVTNGAIPNVPAADASAFIAGTRQRDAMFELVVA